MKKKLQFKSQKERTFLAIRRETKKIFNEKADKSGISKIDFIDKLVNEYVPLKDFENGRIKSG